MTQIRTGTQSILTEAISGSPSSGRAGELMLPRPSSQAQHFVNDSGSSQGKRSKREYPETVDRIKLRKSPPLESPESSKESSEAEPGGE